MPGRPHITGRRLRDERGFTLMDLMIAVVVMGLLMAIALPMYDQFVERAKVAKATGDIGTISVAIGRFRLRNRDRVPMNLDELGMDIPLDPWGRQYQFLNIIDGNPNIGAVRKDGQLNPLNSDFDLYSMGEDGSSRGPLNAGPSRDDIVRANDGAFIGLAEDY